MPTGDAQVARSVKQQTARPNKPCTTTKITSISYFLVLRKKRLRVQD